jgi:hypothetical protein
MPNHRQSAALKSNISKCKLTESHTTATSYLTGDVMRFSMNPVWKFHSSHNTK